MYLVSCTNTHRDVTDLVNHGMVKNTKAWISWEQNIFFLQNKRILNLCFRWHILRSYCFVAEVTFKLLSWNSGLQSNTTCILSALWVWCRWWWGNIPRTWGLYTSWFWGISFVEEIIQHNLYEASRTCHFLLQTLQSPFSKPSVVC